MELQAARQRGLIAYILGTKLISRMKMPTTYSSHENVVSLGTADFSTDRNDASGRGKPVQIKASITENAKEGGEVHVQTNVTGPTLGIITAMSQRSTSLIPQPAEQRSAASAIKKVPLPKTMAHAESS